MPNFNPRSHEGSDISFQITLTGHFDFNPRSHEGSDQSISYIRNGAIYFNPRSHEGSDRNSEGKIKTPEISIHAPTRGATKIMGLFGEYPLFQSTLPRGERQGGQVNEYSDHNFNPRSHEGSDVPSPGTSAVTHEFQSTLPRGERRRITVC